jgi:hypothetical protein
MPSGSTILSTAPAGGKAERGKKYKIRNEEASAAGLNHLINMNLTHSLTLSRTCDAFAVVEVHTLHALGEHDLVDST